MREAASALPIIRMRGVTKRFGDLTVLDALDLDVTSGEKVAVIGPSGSGKSTLLRILMTLERPDAGRIEIDGESVWTEMAGAGEVPAGEAHLRRMRSQLGMVFQSFNLFPHMTVLENVTVAPRLVARVPREEVRSIGEDLLATVGLTEKADAYPAQLSGGQRQRVAIARALAARPRIMLFDEITSALDPELVGEVLDVLRVLSRKREVTMLVVTHEMGFAREIADRVLFFDEGRIVEEGDPEALLARPEKERTREFLRTILGASRPPGRRHV